MSTQTGKDNLEWGEHNPKPTDNDKVEPKLQKTDKDEEVKSDTEEVDLSKKEPGRNRKGVKEGESSISKDGPKN